MEVLKGLPDKSFNLAIVDPPYFSGPERRGYYGSKISKIGVARTYHKSANWEVPGKEYFDELLRVSQHYIIWGCNYFDYHFASGRIVWDKCNGKSSFSDCELAATDLFDSVRLFPFMWNGMCQGKSMTEGRIMQGNKKLNEIRIHPTQKPIALYGWLLTQYAKEGWRILDTHLGSGSIAIACEQLGYRLLGIELDQHYYDAAVKRLNDYRNEPRLF
ncbi:MAG: site-specific DNA-methyltransferase [Muribaculaceae bacterium]|nr:site-specific DNA-methyltransferase [Muribaculaceae bacterium]